ncbi:hypothetical protein B6D60_11690 [candidate division KSB1 bacterium 4484_87]|nr:MAG: hypothetical protein B6D60_11690 [candidate division KSB1 bacterium 4484_87]
MRKTKIGLLPLYLKLYDEICPDDNDAMEAFAENIASEYRSRDIDVCAAQICKEKHEFRKAIDQFEEADVDAIVTLHLAYSPSLESIDAVAGTELPIIILDTTPDFKFGFGQTSDKIMYNHGIHGVQDFCNLLIRRDKKFILEAGHWKESDVIDRTVLCVKGCQAARNMKTAKVGIIGEPFAGMGDFALPFDLLKKEIGMEVVSADSEQIVEFMPEIDSVEVKAETEKDLACFQHDPALDQEALAVTEATGLGVRKWAEEQKLTAMTVNFQNITGEPGLPIMPFLEVSKAMSRGLGYAGEGDVMTAALCGALAQVIPETTFTEMFCPDWEGDRIFMSHMGEINTALTGEKPMLELRPYPFSAAAEPVIASGCLKPGNAQLINLAPGPDDTFSLIVAPVEVCNTAGNEKIDSGVRGWIKPQMPINDFLKQYSQNGGTHHSVLCYNVSTLLTEAFAKSMNWNFVIIN